MPKGVTLHGELAALDSRQYRQDSYDGEKQRPSNSSQFDENTAQYIELQPGQMSLHDIGVLHGSGPNTSGRRRTGLALRYLPSTAWFRRDASVENSKLDWTLLPLQLVRGVNRNELNDLRVGHGDFDPLTTSATF